MITQINSGAGVEERIKKGLNLFGINNQIKRTSKFGTEIEGNVHHHWLWSYNLISSLLKSKNMIVHSHGSDSDITKFKQNINAKNHGLYESTKRLIKIYNEEGLL